MRQTTPMEMNTLGKYRKYIKIWRTDNNGQIERNKHNSKVIGKWALSNTAQAGNGVMRSNTCVKNETICANTHTYAQGITINLIYQHGTDGVDSRKTNRLCHDR